MQSSVHRSKSKDPQMQEGGVLVVDKAKKIFLNSLLNKKTLYQILIT